MRDADPLHLSRALLITIVLTACSGPVVSIPPDSAGPERFVRLEARTDQPRLGREPFAHPLRLTAADWGRILSQIRFQSRKDTFIFTTAKERPADAFAPDEAAYLGAALSQAFAQARPDQWVGFALSRETPSGVTELTTGGWFAEGTRLHLVLANYRHAPAKAGVLERLWRDPLESVSTPFYAVVETDTLSVQKKGGVTGLWSAAGPEIVIEYTALLRTAPKPVPVPPATAAPAVRPAQASAETAPRTPGLQETDPLTSEALEERLRTLKRLKELGLISEEEYRAKKKELLDRL